MWGVVTVERSSIPICGTHPLLDAILPDTGTGLFLWGYGKDYRDGDADDGRDLPHCVLLRTGSSQNPEGRSPFEKGSFSSEW